ncbi:MAG: ubiquinol-cytochrome c reductase iron-sulfur subunit, partial [Gammaproteobacteria bacterium]|nr:ubiquinol-cytochrome c reductase iron-sulfur subunit [Gammaproteobacteria bacterium]
YVRGGGFLTSCASIVGGVGMVTTVVPFVKSMNPSAKTQAAGAPVEVDLTKIEPGEMVREEWRGKPVWIVNRTKQMLQTLKDVEPQLRDPNSEQPQQPSYAHNEYRSIKPEFLVLVGICTHLGCSPTYRPDVGAEDLGANWEGGFFCACHGSRFDLAGRVFRGVPAPKNLEVPPYRYAGDDKIVIGESEEEKA